MVISVSNETHSRKYNYFGLNTVRTHLRDSVDVTSQENAAQVAYKTVSAQRTNSRLLQTGKTTTTIFYFYVLKKTN